MLRQITRTSLQHIRRLTPSYALRSSAPSARPQVAAVGQWTSARLFSYTAPKWEEEGKKPVSYTITELATDRYHRLSDEILEHMCSKLEELADEIDMKGFDVEYNQGVMTISVGEHGTYVINKQPPNHQIWLSSPLSGPQRYDFDDQHHKWFYHRDNHTLDEVLNTELSDALGRKVDLLEGYEPEEK